MTEGREIDGNLGLFWYLKIKALWQLRLALVTFVQGSVIWSFGGCDVLTVPESQQLSNANSELHQQQPTPITSSASHHRHDLHLHSNQASHTRLNQNIIKLSSIMPGLTSASGVLGFLSEEESELKIFALQTLNDDIDTLWTEVAGSVGQM
jgi:hypothetical protein